jgi:hypothetical protein
MYSIGQDARWRDKELWPWAVRVPAAVGYVLLLIALLRLWKRPAPRWAPRWLIAISMLSIAVWTASQFVTLECNAARVQFHVYDGVVSLYVNDVPFGAAGINRGGRSGWSIHRNPPALTINRGGFLSILGARVTLNLPLVPVIVVTLPAAILFGRSRRIRPGHCKRCRYDLTGNVTGVCSECGLPFVLGPSSETESANSSSPPIDGL